MTKTFNRNLIGHACKVMKGGGVVPSVILEINEEGTLITVRYLKGPSKDTKMVVPPSLIIEVGEKL